MENKLKFQANVKKGNNRGTGFISIPREIRNNFEKELQIQAIINSGVLIHAKIKHYGTLGFYVPYKVMNKQILMNNFVNVEIQNVDGFYTSIGDDGRIYIPQKIAEKQSLKNNDILEIEARIGGVKEIKYPMLSVRVKENTVDYLCLFNHNKSGSNGVFKVVRKLDYPIRLANLLNGLHAGIINDEKCIVYGGNHHPIIINSKVELSEIANYLGCYFADGTKRGNNWGICASTSEQANHYYKIHNNLIKSAKVIPIISFTDTEDKNEKFLSEYLNNYWKNNVSYLSDKIKVRIIKSKFEPSLKTGKFGSLVMKENRQLTQIYYNRLLQHLFNEIKLNQDKELAIDFICGVLEGDGSVGPEGRGHLIITSNKKELKILYEIIEYTGIKCHLKMEGENKGGIHIGLLEIIRNIGSLKYKIFKYYPKRRKLLKDRIYNTASVRFLLGENNKTSNWLIGQFNEMKILDGKGNLTEFGVKIRNDLRWFLIK